MWKLIMLKQKCFFITLLATFGLISVILQIYENTYLQFKENGYFSWMTHHGIDDNDTTDGNCTRRDEEKAKSYQSHYIGGKTADKAKRIKWLDGAAYLGSQYKKFRPSLSRHQLQSMVSLWNEFTGLCKHFKLPLILYYGTLLGSHRHHGIIPWDDDLDVLLNSSYRGKFEQYFSRLPGYQLETMQRAPGHSFLQLFKVNNETTFENGTKWPFVDVSFYEENETHIFDSAWYNPLYNRFVWEKTRLFPLKQRPFEGELFNVPCDVEYALAQGGIWNADYCKTHDYNHVFAVRQSGIMIEC